MSRFGVAVVTASAWPLVNRSRPLYYPAEEIASECTTASPEPLGMFIEMEMLHF